MNTNEEYITDRLTTVNFIVNNLGLVDKEKLKRVINNNMTMDTINELYILALESKLIAPENTIQNVVTSETINELREQIAQIQTDLIENISALDKKIEKINK